MNEVSVNKFIKGIVSDLDPSIVPNDRWVFPTSGIRIINVPGKGFVANLANGTEVYLEIYNKNSPLFLPFNVTGEPYFVGGLEYKGILYLVIVYDGAGKYITEIGCYKSPKQYKWDEHGWYIDTAEKGFEDVYKPLLTISGTHLRPIGRYPLFTENFNYTKDSIVSVIGKESYDGSLDLYLCDGKNPNYVINTGFDQSGTDVGRIYDKNHFDEGLLFNSEFLQIKGVAVYPRQQDIILIDDGYLKYGCYYFFIRYVSESFDRTGFVSEVGPVQIGRGAKLYDLEGGPAEEHGTKSVTIKVDNHDPTYQYVEIAFIRYYGDLGFTKYESFLISKKFDKSNQITITGYEVLEHINLADIVKPNIVEKKCFSHIEYNNAYIGINWEGNSYSRADLAALFLKIKPTHLKMLDKTMADPDYWAYKNSALGIDTAWENHKRYKDYKNTLNYVGYYRGEIYPFAGIALFEDGTVTDAFPLQGGRFIEEHQEYGDYNNKGIVAFPDYGENGLSGINDQERILGVSFDLFDFNNEIRGEEKYKKIKGIYIVRGERLGNLICQGVMYPAAAYRNEVQQVKFAPVLDRVPLIKKDQGEGDTAPGDDYYYDDGFLDVHHPTINATYQNKIWAVFAPDHIFDKVQEIVPTIRGCVKIFKFINNAYDLNTQVKIHSAGPGNTFRFAPRKFFEDIRPVKSIEKKYVNAQVTFIKENDPSKSHDGNFWGTYFERGDLVNYVDFADRRTWNRKMKFIRYIALTFDNSVDSVYWSFPLDPHYIPIFPEEEEELILERQLRYLVNIYRGEHDSLSLYNVLIDSFTPETTIYNKISDLITKNDLQNIMVFYKGDCFMQRSSYRLLHWHDIKDGQGWEDWAEEKKREFNQKITKYGHGMISSFCCESSVNTAMRDDDKGDETYFPKIADKALEWVFNTYSQYINEAFYYNPGYHKVLSVVSSIGNNIAVPFHISKKTTRLRWSARANPGQYYDAWRIFDINGYNDYSIAYGALIRVFEHMGILCSVQEKGINRHIAESNDIVLPTSQADIILGVKGFISNNVIRIAEYGSQHFLSMVKGENGIYGFDYMKKIFWMVKAQMSQYGKAFIDSYDLSKSQSIHTELHRLISVLDSNQERPYNDKGIILGYDSENKEVHACILPNNETLVYSESLDHFIGMLPYKANRYIQHLHGLISVKKHWNKIVLHRHLFDKDDVTKNTFHDNSDVMFTLSWIVNGSADEGRDMIIKIFESMHIESLFREFNIIKFATEYQEYDGNFIKRNTIESVPEYHEGVWVVPIPTAKRGSSQFDEGSNMNGAFLKVTVHYRSPEKYNQFVKHVKTFYNRSFY